LKGVVNLADSNVRYYSPLRYPGGKGAIASCLADIIMSNNLESCQYFEPYAGGAGAAFYLLLNGFVKNISINDADFSIFALWNSIIHSTDRFIEKISTVELSIDEWLKQKKIISSPLNYSEFEVGFSAFYLNRCNRSGIINNAGPIGGYSQKGKWKVGVRFNRDNLINRIKEIANFKGYISVYNLDAIEFLKRTLPKGKNRKKAFIYLDPPYFLKGKKLYLTFYKKSEHEELSNYMKRQNAVSWIMTYDNAEEIKNLYQKYRLYEFSLQYSLQEKRTDQEIMIVPKNIFLPRSTNIAGRNLKISMAS
jgi:DNA adenine methylase